MTVMEEGNQQCPQEAFGSSNSLAGEKQKSQWFLLPGVQGGIHPERC